MDGNHFIKMLFGLIFMAIIGVGGLLVLNHYARTPGTTTATNP